MTFSISLMVKDGSPILETVVCNGIRSAVELTEANVVPQTMTRAEVNAYFAMEYVRQIIHSQVLGALDKTYSVVVSGNVTPEPESAEGEDKDSLTISIAQL